MIKRFSLGDESPFHGWEGCGVGSYVVFEHHSERKLPDLDTLAKQGDLPEGFSIDSMLQSMGIDPATRKVHHVMTSRQRVVKVTKNGITIEHEMDTPFPLGEKSRKTRHTLRARPRPMKQTRKVVSEGPDSHAEVIRTPLDILKPLAPPKESEESLLVAGQPIRCRVSEVTFPLEDREMWMKIWRSSVIPGGLARQETKYRPADEQVQWMVVTSFEKKT